MPICEKYGTYTHNLFIVNFVKIKIIKTFDNYIANGAK